MNFWGFLVDGSRIECSFVKDWGFESVSNYGVLTLERNFEVTVEALYREMTYGKGEERGSSFK